MSSSWFNRVATPLGFQDQSAHGSANIGQTDNWLNREKPPGIKRDENRGNMQFSASFHGKPDIHTSSR